MKKFHIFLPENDEMNYAAILDKFNYYPLAEVEVERLEYVFQACQNPFNEQYAALGVRSMSVGDVIHDLETDKLHMICGIGMKEIGKMDFYQITRLNDVIINNQIDKLPFVVVLGIAIGLLSEYCRYKNEQDPT